MARSTGAWQVTAAMSAEDALFRVIAPLAHSLLESRLSSAVPLELEAIAHEAVAAFQDEINLDGLKEPLVRRIIATLEERLHPPQ
jgi:hypothetical protein